MSKFNTIAAVAMSAMLLPSWMQAQQMRTHMDFPETAKYTAVLEEDFSNFTAGSENNPDPALIDQTTADALTQVPGWNLFRCQQAGGVIYTGYDDEGEDGPGYIQTPPIDFAKDGGIFRVRVKAKNVNASVKDMELQSYILDDYLGNKKIISASTEPMQYGEWVECTWTCLSGGKATTIMLYGWQGHVLLKDLVVETVDLGIGMAKVKEAKALDIDKVRIAWDKVPTATRYTLRVEEIEDYEPTEIISQEYGDVDTADLNFLINPANQYRFYLTASNDEYTGVENPATFRLEIGEIGECVASNATNINNEGFTANWQRATFAAKYAIFPELTRTAQTNGEEIVLLDEDFTYPGCTVSGRTGLAIGGDKGANLDIALSRRGWTSDGGKLMSRSMFCPSKGLWMDNLSGTENNLKSPVYDFSTGSGNVSVKGSVLSIQGPVLVHVSLVDAEGEEYSMQEIEVPEAMTSTDFDVTLENGKADSRFKISLYDTEEMQDAAIVSSLRVTKTLNQGQQITVPGVTCFANYDQTSQRVEVAINEGDQYSYTVMPYCDANIYGQPSQAILVSDPTGIGHVQNQNSTTVAVVAGKLVINNPENLPVATYAISGQPIAIDAMSHGVYIVVVGSQTFKVMMK